MRVVSGIQPTGELHLGNYLGALRQWVALQSEAECFFIVADLHGITTPQDPTELRKQTLDTAALLLAIGIDPERSVFFLQSRVPQHTELAWVLNCLATVGELRRMVQFKEKSARGADSEATAGLPSRLRSDWRGPEATSRIDTHSCAAFQRPIFGSLQITGTADWPRRGADHGSPRSA